MNGGNLFLGDIARAFDRLRPTDADARHRIIRALGFEPGEVELRPPGSARPIEKPPLAFDEDDALDETRESVTPPVSDFIDTSGPLPNLVGRPDPQLDRTRPLWLSEESLALPPQEDASARAQLPLEPLFKPAWLRGILVAALATTAEEGAIDVVRMVGQLARARPLRNVPRARVPILRNGIHIVLDKREAMNPFLGDQAHLVESVRRIIGREATMVFDMEQTPMRVRRSGVRHGWTDYQAPRAGTPVLVVSDLGIGQPAFAADIVLNRDWLAFADLLRRAGCPLIAFVPYPQARWPQDLAGRYRIVAWDRHTSAAVAARAARGGKALVR